MRTLILTAAGIATEVDKERRTDTLDSASQLSFLNENSLSDAFLETMFKRPDIFDPMDFPDGVLSQTAGDVPKPPEEGPGPSQEGPQGDLPPSASAVSVVWEGGGPEGPWKSKDCVYL